MGVRSWWTEQSKGVKALVVAAVVFVAIPITLGILVIGVGGRRLVRPRIRWRRDGRTGGTDEL